MSGALQFPRRSFIHRRLADTGAVFEEAGDTSVAAAFPGRGGLPRRLALIDLSPLPRTGFKGRTALHWLTERGLAVPGANNRAATLPDDTLIARLANSEALLLGPPAGGGTPISSIESAQRPSGCYPAPRRDSHCWYILCGEKAVGCLQKLCGVDLRPQRFPDHCVAQTSVARLSTILIRQDRGATPAFHLLCDSAAALYFWDVLMDAMGEFLGGPAGLRGLRALGPKPGKQPITTPQP